MKIKVITLIVALLVGSGYWWFLGRHPDTNTTLHDYSDTTKKESSQYICPMHPQITSDKPRACPICGMDLVPIEDSAEDETHDHEKHKKEGADEWENVSQSEDSSGYKKIPDNHTDFKLSLRKQQMIGIKIAKAQKKKLFKSIRAPGRIAFDPDLYTAQNEYLEALKQWRRVKNSPLSDVRRNTRQMINSSKVRLKIFRSL